MQYLYNKNAKEAILEIDGEEYRHLFRARRTKVGTILSLRNLEDNKLYSYKVVNIGKKSATLELLYAESKDVIPLKELIIGWCIIDPKNIEKTLPILNEIGVSKIVFIKCAYSQSSYKIKKDKLQKIVINSSQQCGRSNLLEIDFANSIFDFLAENPDSYLLNFSDNLLDESKDKIKSIVIGCEGGLTEDEVALFKKDRIVGFNTPLILQSQSATIVTAGKILI
jgi:16S rRNA (uracil1498-N3)-methyltransferase